MLADDAPSVSTFIEREATAAQVARVHGPPLGVPAQGGRPALVGAAAAVGQRRRRRWSRSRPTSTATAAPTTIHAELFARAMDAVGLDSTYGAYLDQIPGVTLATVNLMSLFGLHRRLRGAIVGHLALFEMTSSVPEPPLRRPGCGGSATARTRPSSSTSTSSPTPCTRASPRSISRAGSRSQDPRLGADVLWGARALLAIDGRWARHMMAAWEARRRPRCDAGARAAVTADELRAVFDAPEPLTVGLEEEVMLRRSRDAGPRRGRGARSSAAASRGSSSSCPRRSSRSSPRPRRAVGDAIAELAGGRARAGRAGGAGARGRSRPACIRSPRRSATLNAGERYDAILADYGDVARSQLVCALQVHVAVGLGRRDARRLQRAARRTCPSSPRWPPTRRSTPAATRASRRSGR